MDVVMTLATMFRICSYVKKVKADVRTVCNNFAFIPTYKEDKPSSLYKLFRHCHVPLSYLFVLEDLIMTCASCNGYVVTVARAFEDAPKKNAFTGSREGFNISCREVEFVNSCLFFRR